MPHPAEVAFVQHLAVSDSLATIVQDDWPEDFLPTESLRRLMRFVFDYWFESPDRGLAPSIEAIRAEFGNVLAEHEIDLDIDPEDSLEYAVEQLRGLYTDRHWQMWMRGAATAMAEAASPVDKLSVMSDEMARLMMVQSVLMRRREQDEVTSGAIARAVDRYEERARDREQGIIRGMVSGVSHLDEHTLGFKPGHIAVFGGVPKVGKSFLVAHSAIANWRMGKTVQVFTLELMVPEMIDRIACMAAGVDYGAWVSGTCSLDEIDRVRQIATTMQSGEVGSGAKIIVTQPPPEQRTIEHMTRRAMSEADVFIVDQITFIRPNPGTERLPQWQQIGIFMHDLKSLLARGEGSAAMLMHQISREGIRSARSAGRLLMDHLAGASEIERTADWVFGMWQSEELRQVGRLWLQSLALRHAEKIDLELVWRPWVGQVQSQGRIEIEE